MNQTHRFRILCAIVLMALLGWGAYPNIVKAASWSFAVLGDQRDEGTYGINQTIVEKMAAQIATQNPAFVLCGGDQIHGVFNPGEAPLPDQYTHWKAAMAPILSISYPVRGNHETHGDVNTPGPDYAKYWMDNIANALTQIPKNGPPNEVGMSYSFSKNNVCLIGLEESYATSWYQVNQAWLNAQLTANTLPITIVYGHYPAFGFAETLEPGSLADHPTQRDAFWKSLGDSSVKIYFAGHVHSYNRAEISIDGGPEIQQIVVGTGGAPLTTWDGKYSDPRVIGESHLEHQYGYSLVTVDGNKITVVHYTYKSTTNTWSAFDTYIYTITSRKFGANNANQSIDPSILTNYYQGISLLKIGLGTLTLNAGTSTYADAITVSAGGLNVQGDYSSAPVKVQSGAQLILGDGKVAGVTIDSGGAFSGTGTVVGNLTNDGTGNLSGGSLSVGGNEVIGNNGTGVFTQTGGTNAITGNLYLGYTSGASGTYNLSAGLLDPTDEYVGYSGTGTFNQSGGTHVVTGSLFLGYNAGASGTYNLSGGSLSVGGNEVIGNNGTGVFTQTGGTNAITGNLSVGAGAGSGTYALWGGSATVGGNYTQGANGTFSPGISSATNFANLMVGGTASLAGTIAPTLLGGYLPRGNQVFPGVITATGGITGAFSTIPNQQISPTLFWQARYNPTSVDLWVQRNYTNSGLSLNSNQQGVGTMLNSVASATTGDLDTVLNAIDYLPDSASVRNAFKQISPEKAGALANLGFVAATFQMRNLATRTTNLRFVQGESSGGGGLNSGGLRFNYSQLEGMMLAYNGASLSNLFSARKEFTAPESRWGLFADGGAAFGNQKTSVNQTGYNFTLGGFTIGADYRLRDNLLVGLATGYSNTSSSFYGSGGNVNANTVPFNAFAAYFPGSLYAYGSVGYALNLYDLKRGINFGGLARTASCSTTGNQFNLYGETGYDLRLSRFILTPSATLAYSALWVGGVTEQGAGALNLKVAAQSANSLQTGIGGRLTVPLQVGSVKVAPQGYAFYQHEFANGSRGLNASLSQGSSTFNFQTDDAKRNFAVVGANVTVGLTKNLYAQVNYNAEVGRGNYTAQNINAGLRLEF